MGVMAYVSCPLWLLFLVLSTIHVFNQVLSSHGGGLDLERYMQIFGQYVEVPEALSLFLFTMLLLFLPKIISVTTVLQRSEQAVRFGGRWPLVLSAASEIVLSALLAPVHMFFNSKFVFFTLLGQGVSWVTQRRGAEDGTDWREAIITHGGQTFFGLVWGVSSFILLPSFFWWLSPVLAGLVLSIPVSIILSKGSLGAQARRIGLFLTPEETQPPYELSRLTQNLAACYKHMQPIETLRNDYGLLQAVLDPYINAVHVAMLRQRRPSEESRDWFSLLRHRLLSEGPGQLTTKETLALLLDAESMIWLHEELWKQPSSALAEWWRLAMRQYNVLTATPITALYR
jgi:membrane glycosyltransferase